MAVDQADALRQTGTTSVLAAFIGAMVHQLFDGTMISVHLGVGLWALLAILMEALQEACVPREGDR